MTTTVNGRYTQSSGSFECHSGVSVTVPEMAISIKDLISRYTRGLPVAVREGEYFGDDENDPELFPDLRRMDIVEIRDLRDATEARIKELRNKAVAEAADAKKKRDEAAAEFKKKEREALFEEFKRSSSSA